MAHEFVARKGIIVSSGSLVVTSGSVTASNFVGTASAAISSSFATTASYALVTDAAGFPFTGDAIITGSLYVSGGFVSGAFVGDGSGLDNLRTSLAIDEYIFIGDGVTDTYTLSSSYATPSLNVSVGGLRYVSPNDYTVSADTIQFVQAPASSSLIVIDAFLIISSGSIGTFSGSFIGTSSWADNAISSSFATTAISASYATTSSYVLPSGLPAGTVSASSQVSYTGLSNIPDGIVSSSGQVTSLLPAGTVSSSAQATTWTVATASFASGAALLNTYTLTTSSLGNATGATTASLTVARYFTATTAGATQWAFQNAVSGRGEGFVLELTNGGSAAQTWPTTIRWPGGTAPTLTTSGVDVLTFLTDDGGSNWRGVASMLDSK